MANKELRKMRRTELIEIIYALETREAQLQQEKEALEAKLKEREIILSESGSIAEAALRLNKVFEAAQAAADDYVASVKRQTQAPAQETPEQTEAEDASEETPQSAQGTPDSEDDAS